MAKPARDELLRGALDRFPRWRLFGEGTATARFEFSEQIYAAGFVTRVIEQARAFGRIPDLSLSGQSVKLALALSLGEGGLSDTDAQLLEAIERAGAPDHGRSLARPWSSGRNRSHRSPGAHWRRDGRHEEATKS